MKILDRIITEIIESDGSVVPIFNSASRLIDDLSFDSLKMIDLIVYIENQIGFSISEEQINSVKTVGDLEKILGASNAEV